MSFIEPHDFIIYLHLNTRIKILPLATFQIAHLCNEFIMFALPISMPCFKSIIFLNQNSPKMKLFLQKHPKILSARGTAPSFPCLRRLGALPPYPLPPAAGGFSPRPLKQLPFANFWLCACSHF